MALIGTLVAESLRVGGVLEDVVLMVHKVARDAVGDVDGGKPVAWTFLDFEATDEDANRLASSLQHMLDPHGGWYCEFWSDDETFVVFAERIFRFPRGDPSGRHRAEVYGRSAGVPTAHVHGPEQL
jgi:hypothetical protein